MHLLVPAVLALFGTVIAFVVASGGGGRAAETEAPDSLAAIARAGGCGLIELDRERPTNPPVTGRFSESQWLPNGDYSQANEPISLPAVVHALLHGRVAIQYRPGLARPAVARLRRFYREDRRNVLLFANQTGMSFDVAATAYLSAVVCPRFSQAALDALRAFRERRRDFRQRH